MPGRERLLVNSAAYASPTGACWPSGASLGPMSGAPAARARGRRRTTRAAALHDVPVRGRAVARRTERPSVPSVPCVPSVERRRRRREPPEMCWRPSRKKTSPGRPAGSAAARRRGVVVSSPTTAPKATTGILRAGPQNRRRVRGGSVVRGGRGQGAREAGRELVIRRGSEVRAPTRTGARRGPTIAPVRFRTRRVRDGAARSAARGRGGASREGRVGGTPPGARPRASARRGRGGPRGVSAATGEDPNGDRDLRSPARRTISGSGRGRWTRASPEAARGARGVRARGARAAFRRGGIARGGRGRDDVWRPKGAPRSATRPRNAHEPTTRFSCHHFFVVPRDSSFPVPLGRATVQDSSGEDHKRSIRS